MTKAELIAALEKATGPDRYLFEAIYAAMNGGRLFDDPGAPDFQASFARWQRFSRMLDAGAYESAALTLVPEGWGWAWDIDEIAVLTELDGDGHEIGAHHLFAHAIVIAALKAGDA